MVVLPPGEIDVKDAPRASGACGFKSHCLETQPFSSKPETSRPLLALTNALWKELDSGT